MQIRSAMHSAALGLAMNRAALDGRAHAIANAADGDIDLVGEIVGTVVSSRGYEANAMLLRTAAETDRSLFDALA
jgi:flagellar basal body rod protein FlgC